MDALLVWPSTTKTHKQVKPFFKNAFEPWLKNARKMHWLDRIVDLSKKKC